MLIVFRSKTSIICNNIKALGYVIVCQKPSYKYWNKSEYFEKAWKVLDCHLGATASAPKSFVIGICPSNLNSCVDIFQIWKLCYLYFILGIRINCWKFKTTPRIAETHCDTLNLAEDPTESDLGTTAGAPKCPEWLGRHYVCAQVAWNTWAPLLVRPGPLFVSRC